MISSKTIYLAQPRGFCAGVERAILIVEEALKRFGAPIYVRHEIIHNAYVVKDFESKGVVFVNDLSLVPKGAILIFSAHGVSKAVRFEADEHELTVFDATCPLVAKVHAEVVRLKERGYQIIMIGHHGHPEVEGTMGQVDASIHLIECVSDVAKLNFSESDLLAYVTQTTLSIDETHEIAAALVQRYPQIHAPKRQDICYATQNRQDAVKAMAPQVDLVIVVGSQNSSNSKRLQELATSLHIPAYLVDEPSQIQNKWFRGVANIGITAGASAPEALTAKIIEAVGFICQAKILALDGIEENVNFSLPKALLQAA
ncbi:4-hydroxy-3-methylbut-2-enyl diphosphate reductase [Polynucleobacter wuianus]|uniref:4-hydroxy-3-methylbut-2-enyl diphosphate reductase n=1 Tax=Polynucleobacter wuianus TaxID=1743168 RepID=A0A191UGH2_9BURK|nr:MULTISPECIES: 4-hydroxy-3-methylbut-2-enyl diphosphate reductase [Polynucleobacter]ANJ00104.1 4-hydroxy-3-methylbut-2-enyl diphosphate reductase [Polynucleobacter wuianus]MBU3553559.1 4-hydroxy-3-methylbut-2-enyl diphosphate reductase [Polynucleobacter sp. MWH-Post4-6-1]MBU3610230.1 4-hydroxy-3-methylbut-2-enyl diphosphate reductase [Polynucleobacter wuianus]